MASVAQMGFMRIDGIVEGLVHPLRGPGDRALSRQRVDRPVEVYSPSRGSVGPVEVRVKSERPGAGRPGLCRAVRDCLRPPGRPTESGPYRCSSS